MKKHNQTTIKYLALSLLLIGFLMPIKAQSDWKKNYYKHYNFSNYTNFSPFTNLVETTTFDAPLLNAAIFYETNRQRQRYGRIQFQHHENLEYCAQSHSNDMVRLDFFSHDSPISGKREMSDRMAQVGFDNLWMAENISYHDVSNRTYSDLAKSIVDSWMNSQGHRDNILNSRYTYLGVGAASFDNSGSMYIKSTQNFVEAY